MALIWRPSLAILLATASIAQFFTVPTISAAPVATPPASCGDLSPSEDSSPGSESYQDLLKSAVAYLSAPGHLNRGMTVKTRVVLCPEDNSEGNGAEAVPYYAGDVVSGCTLPVYPIGRAKAESDPAVGLAMMTHEVFHCFGYVLGGKSVESAPKWLWEGAAAWAGETAAGGTTYSAGWWPVYLTLPHRSLFERDYSAIGFFAHLDESGIDPWGLFDKLTLAARSSAPVPPGMTRDQYLYSLAIPDKSNALLDSWPSGVIRDPSLGTAWDTSGPGITSDDYKPAPLDLGVSLEVAQAANDVVSLDLAGDVIHVEATPLGNTNGRLRASDGSEWALTNADFCARPDGCACPAGSARSGGAELPSIAPGAALLATTGHVPTQADPTSGSRVTVSNRDLSLYCAESPAASPIGGTPGGGPTGGPCARYQPGNALRAEVEPVDLLEDQCFYTITGAGWTWVRFYDEPPFTLPDGRTVDANAAMDAAIAEAQAHGIGDDRAPVKVEAQSAGGGRAVCITPAERTGRNDVRGHLYVQRGKGWFDLALLDTRASSYRDYPPLCDMLKELAAGIG